MPTGPKRPVAKKRASPEAPALVAREGPMSGEPNVHALSGGSFTRQSPLQSQADLWSRPVLRRSVPIRLKKRKGRPKPPCRGLSKARDELSAVSLRLLRIRDLRPVLHKSSGVRFAPE
jgi:hypothetical protein